MSADASLLFIIRDFDALIFPFRGVVLGISDFEALIRESAHDLLIKRGR
ncbi:hypothetical protein EDD64_11651 [Effusibacillus lacus]|nr:hypothetical protein EDD64_11651 [Effusibacillus lacus]